MDLTPLYHPSCILLQFFYSPKDTTGTYKCVVRTAEDEAEQEFRVEVAQAPIIAPLPEEQFVLVGGSVKLRCEAEGIPRPEASWDDGGYAELGMLNVREGTDQERKVHVR